MKSQLMAEAAVRRQRHDSIGPPPDPLALKAAAAAASAAAHKEGAQRQRKDSIGPPPDPAHHHAHHHQPHKRSQLGATGTVVAASRQRCDSIGPPPDPPADTTATTSSKLATSAPLLPTAAAAAPTATTAQSLMFSSPPLCRRAPHSLPPPTLATVLVNEGLRASFARFLEEELAAESLEFLDECDAFAEAELTPDALAAEARRIYNRYVREGAPQEVNISGPVRKQIKLGVLKPKHGVVLQGVFEGAARELCTLLQENFMARWLAKNEWREIPFTPCAPALPSLRQVLAQPRLRNQFEWFLAGKDQQVYLYAWEALARLQQRPTLEAAAAAVDKFGSVMQQAVPEAFNTLTLALQTQSVDTLRTVDPTPLFRMLQIKWYPQWVVMQTWTLAKATACPSSAAFMLDDEQEDGEHGDAAKAEVREEDAQEEHTVQLQKDSVKHIHADDEESLIAAIAAANAALARTKSPHSPVCGPPLHFRVFCARFDGCRFV